MWWYIFFIVLIIGFYWCSTSAPSLDVSVKPWRAQYKEWVSETNKWWHLRSQNPEVFTCHWLTRLNQLNEQTESVFPSFSQSFNCFSFSFDLFLTSLHSDLLVLSFRVIMWGTTCWDLMEISSHHQKSARFLERWGSKIAPFKPLSSRNAARKVPSRDVNMVSTSC